MTTIGVDIEQFVMDPYSSGIQRVLQYLAKDWPADLAEGAFVVPREMGFLVLDPQQAAELIGLAFAPGRNGDLRIDVNAWLDERGQCADQISLSKLTERIDSWLLPEVSYLPSVLTRFEHMGTSMPTAMIGYDALPMTEPGNYRFPPGVAANASEYFRLLASTNALICISDYSRESITDRLRRDVRLVTSVAHPGGDHVPAADVPRIRHGGPIHFLRLGTMEARKMPLEILRAFLAIREQGVDAQLTFVGGRSSSYEWMNKEVQRACERDIGFEWTSDASDADITRLMSECDALLSFGTEGYGIPVLEAIRGGMPVLYGGTQPAAELLEGSGAMDCGLPTDQELEQVLTLFSEKASLDDAVRQVDPSRVPRWADFASATIATVLRTLGEPG